MNAIRLDGSNGIKHYWWDNDLNVSVGNLADGNWHHVAATFDGTTRSVYVDGILKGSDTPTGHNVPTTATNIRIGSTNNGEYFDGCIDDVGIWNRALTQSEITARQTTAPNGSESGLVAFYSFNEGSGTTTNALGSAGASLSGTLTNGAAWISAAIGTSNGSNVNISSSGGISPFSTGTVVLSTSITAVNDAPVRTSAAPASISVAEDSNNTTAITLGLTNLTYSASGGVDEATQTLTYTIDTIPSFLEVYKADGTTQISASDTLTLTELQGLTYKTVSNRNGSGNITWTVQDNGGTSNGGSDSLSQSLAITVSAVNDSPALSGGGDSVSYTEGVGLATKGTPVLLDANGDTDLTDVELTQRLEDSFDSATLSVSRTGAAVATDRFWFDTGSSVSASGTSDGASLSTTRGVIGAVTTNSAAGTLLVTFNGSATTQDVKEVMRAITYASTDDDFAGNASVSMTFNDGNSGTQGSGGALTNSISFNINVSSTNDAPTLTAGATITTSEDTTSTPTTFAALLAANLNDPDNVTGADLEGVAISGYNDRSLGEWEVNLGTSSTPKLGNVIEH